VVRPESRSPRTLVMEEFGVECGHTQTAGLTPPGCPWKNDDCGCPTPITTAHAPAGDALPAVSHSSSTRLAARAADWTDQRLFRLLQDRHAITRPPSLEHHPTALGTTLKHASPRLPAALQNPGRTHTTCPSYTRLQTALSPPRLPTMDLPNSQSIAYSSRCLC